jgi:NAD+ synthase
MNRNRAPASIKLRSAAKEADRISSFIAKVVREASAGGVVVAISGGIDSAVVGALCTRALGKKRVFALLMPSSHTPEQDTADAMRLVDSWGVRWSKVSIAGLVEGLEESAKMEGTRIAKGNLAARVRMTLLYYYANSLGYLVVGTGDRSEAILGYFTKYGDGGVDFLPIVHLFKTQVRQLGASLGLPPEVVEKPASPQLWPGHRAVDEIPASYEKLDIALHYLYDLGASPVEAARQAGIPKSAVDGAMEMHRRSEHKRALAPSLS